MIEGDKEDEHHSDNKKEFKFIIDPNTKIQSQLET